MPLKFPISQPKNNLMPTPPPEENPEPLDRDPIREARIAVLRRSIANGTYKIPSGDIADRIIDDIIRKP